MSGASPRHGRWLHGVSERCGWQAAMGAYLQRQSMELRPHGSSRAQGPGRRRRCRAGSCGRNDRQRAPSRRWVWAWLGRVERCSGCSWRCDKVGDAPQAGATRTPASPLLATSDLRLAAAAREPPARRHSPTACPSVIPSTRNPRAPPTTPSSSPIAPRGLTKPGADAAGRCTPAMCPPGLHAPSSAHR